VDEHLDPLSETALGGDGTCRGFARAPAARASVAIIAEVYPSLSCQQSVCGLVKRLVKSGHYQGIAVEGEDGPVDASYAARWGPGLEVKMKHSQVSGGVLQAIEDLGGALSVTGVDDLKHARRQQTVQRVCDDGRASWEEVVEFFRKELEATRAKLGYTDDMRFASERSGSSDHDIPLKDRIRRLLTIGTPLGLSLDSFPALRGICAAFDREDALDFPSIEQERTEYVKALVGRVDVGLKRMGNRYEVDLIEIAPSVALWLSDAQRTVDDVRREVAERGLVSVVSEAQEWVVQRIVDAALKYRQGLLSHERFYGQMLAFGARLGLDVLAFPKLREYFAYLEITNSFPRHRLSLEIDSYARDVLKRLAVEPHQQEFLELERLFQILTRAGRLQLTPFEARDLRDDLTWPALARRLERLRGTPVNVPQVGKVEELTSTAFEFCQLSAQRNRHMAERVVDQVSRGSVTGVVLICGGFHTSSVIRILSARHRDVAWSEFLPKMDLSDVPKEARGR